MRFKISEIKVPEGMDVYMPSVERRSRMMVRRVVTGHKPDGKATVVSDTEVEPITLDMLRGAEIHRLWGADATPVFPDDGSARPARNYFPPVGGFRFGLSTVSPQSVELPKGFDRQQAIKEMEEKLPGSVAYMEADSPGMHTTDTIDFEYVISGEVWLELDDGKEVCLRAGDTVVQNGTRHAWRNKGSEPCRLVVCLIGAQRRR
jgi:mannose-6-phosphate isomerase-like protein (cupin superfamily)